jgi:penicillin-binding protein 1C
MDPRAAYIVTDILADSNARVSTFGLGSSLDTPQWSAVKTGTSKDMRDNWCIGFDDRYTVAVWVGNLSGTSMWDVSGVTGAAPVWQTVMAELQRGRRVVAPLPPAGVVSLPIEFGRHVEPPRREAFLAGTELTFVRTADEAGGAGRILYPGAGTVVALDPDIPPLNQRVKFVARLAGHEAAWVLDGRRFALTNAAPSWKPTPGRHRLALVDGHGSELDAVRFEVRGAMKKSSARG